MAHISYVSRADTYSKGLIAVGFMSILFGLINRFVTFAFVNVSWFQLGMVVSIAGILLYAGERLRGGDHTILVWFLWGWALSSLADLMIHIFFMLDVRNVSPSIARWVDGSIQMFFFSIEPWWYFTFVTGIIGGGVVAGAMYTNWPEYTPYKWLVWGLLGGVVKSLYYGDVSQFLGDLTNGLVGTDSTGPLWEWSSYWVELYNSFTGNNLPMSYVSAGEDYAIVFALFGALHWSVYWVAGVVASHWFTER